MGCWQKGWFDLGSRDSSVVRALSHDWKVMGLSPWLECWSHDWKVMGLSPWLQRQSHDWKVMGLSSWLERWSHVWKVMGLSPWLERQSHDWKVMGLSPGRSSSRISFFRVNFLCWLLFWYPSHPRVTVTAHFYYDHIILPKSAGGGLKPNTHAPYIRDFCMKWCDMVHCCVVHTLCAPRQQQIYMAPVMEQPNSAVIQWIFKTCCKKMRQSLIANSRATRAQWVCSRTENGAI